MSIEENPLIRVAPYTQGASTETRIVIRRRDHPQYICLTREEFAAVEQLRYQPMQVSEWLSEHMSQHQGLSFRGAISLLLRLIEEGFLLDTSTGIVQKLEDLHHGGRASSFFTRSYFDSLLQNFDLSLMEVKSITVHPLLRFFGQVFASWLGVILLLTICILGFWRVRFVSLEQLAGLFPFETPETWFFTFVIMLSLAGCLHGILQIMFVSGTQAEFVHGDARLSGGFALNVRCRDDDVIMCDRNIRIPYQLSCLLLPFVLSLLCLQKYRMSSSLAMLGLSFAIIGLVQLCPLFRSPVVKLAEGETASLQLLDSLQRYLKRGFFKQLFQAQDQQQPQENQSVSHWILGLSCLALVWLYAVGIILFSVLVDAVPHLLFHLANASEAPLRAGMSMFWLIVLTLATLYPLKTLLQIPLFNLAEAVSIPMRKARSGLHGFVDHSVRMTEVIENFLREIPILAHLSELELHALIPSLKMRTFGRGQLIIKQGEPGDEFYILAEGDAQIYLSQNTESNRVLDMLHPGDSFGEIALIERTTRRANVKAMSPDTKVLVLRREAFDGLFPEGSSVREGLTQTMRLMKLVLESQALSHLSPRQVREFVRSARVQAFAEGEFLIREHDMGQTAYLIESGEVAVSKAGFADDISQLGRGDLLGATALIRNVTRTASVRALTPVQALVIDKDSFLRLCMANVFVALLVNDLIDKQQSEISESA